MYARNREKATLAMANKQRTPPQRLVATTVTVDTDYEVQRQRYRDHNLGTEMPTYALPTMQSIHIAENTGMFIDRSSPYTPTTKNDLQPVVSTMHGVLFDLSVDGLPAGSNPGGFVEVVSVNGTLYLRRVAGVNPPTKYDPKDNDHKKLIDAIGHRRYRAFQFYGFARAEIDTNDDRTDKGLLSVMISGSLDGIKNSTEEGGVFVNDHLAFKFPEFPLSVVPSTDGYSTKDDEMLRPTLKVVTEADTERMLKALGGVTQRIDRSASITSLAPTEYTRGAVGAASGAARTAAASPLVGTYTASVAADVAKGTRRGAANPDADLVALIKNEIVGAFMDYFTSINPVVTGALPAGFDDALDRATTFGARSLADLLMYTMTSATDNGLASWEMPHFKAAKNSSSEDELHLTWQ